MKTYQGRGSMKTTTLHRRAILGSSHMLLLLAPMQQLRPLLPSSEAADLDLVSGTAEKELLDLIPAMPYGAPATNLTLSASLSRDIEVKAIALEAVGMRELARSRQLNGSWRLLYSNAREITNLASGLPLGFVLGPTYQPLDVIQGLFENQGLVQNAFGLASLSTRVVGDLRPAAAGTLNAAGIVNSRGDRVDVCVTPLTFPSRALRTSCTIAHVSVLTEQCYRVPPGRLSTLGLLARFGWEGTHSGSPEGDRDQVGPSRSADGDRCGVSVTHT